MLQKGLGHLAAPYLLSLLVTHYKLSYHKFIYLCDVASVSQLCTFPLYLFTFVTCCSLQIILSQNYLLPIISVLAENTLLKTAYHFLLLLVGFDSLTYRKGYDRSLHLLVINTLFWRRCRGVKHLW